MKYTQKHLQNMLHECKELQDYWQELIEAWNETGDRETSREAVKAHKEYIACMEHIIFTMLPNMKTETETTKFPAVPYYDEIF